MAQTTNKLTWVELKRAIAHSTDIPDKDVSVFMTALTQTISETLEKGEQVKINGLGTFKVQTMAPRKSVNIATGENIMIDSYAKPTFTADYNAKHSVNDTPAATADPMKKLTEQANEILDILADLETVQEDRPETVIPESPEIPEPPRPTEATEPEATTTDTKKQPRPFRPWLATGIIVSLFCLALIGGYIFLQNKIEQWVNILSERTNGTTPLTQEEDESIAWELTEAETEKTLEKEDSVSQQEEKLTSVKYTSTDNLTYNKFITTETLTQGSRLAWLAYKYYGEKQLWVFIYDANKDRIAHPSRIVVGTKVKIPDLDSELRDVNNPNTQKLIKELEHKFLDGR